MRPVVCALLVVNWLAFKSVAVRKHGNVLSCAGGQSRKPAVAQDAGVTRYFDENIFKTKLETERSVPVICPGNDRARRVDIANARLADRAVAPENHERT
jgi:hypothetical protein